MQKKREKQLLNNFTDRQIPLVPVKITETIEGKKVDNVIFSDNLGRIYRFETIKSLLEAALNTYENISPELQNFIDENNKKQLEKDGDIIDIHKI